MLKQAQRDYYKNLITKNYQKSATLPLDAMPKPVQSYINEVIDALSMACTMTRPRHFCGKEMTAKDFQRIADKFNETICSVAVEALNKQSSNIKNRPFYIMGVLARF